MIKMKRYWYDYLLDDERKCEDDKATVYDTSNLNELASWSMNELGFNVT